MKPVSNKSTYIPGRVYQKIVRLIPIACVDLVVENHRGEVLLLRRKNEPAKNEWWFPGGRIHFMETRKEAALRKLKEECGLQGKIAQEVGTFDIIIKSNAHAPSHAVTTVFQILVKRDKVKVDRQSFDYKWLLPPGCLELSKSGFVRRTIRKIYASHDLSK